jgi:hypothetical protein
VGTEGTMKRKRASRFSLESNTAAPRRMIYLPDIVHEAGIRSFHPCASPRIGNAACRKHGFAVDSHSHDGPVRALHLPKQPVLDLEADVVVAADDDSVDDEPPDIQAEIEVGTGCSRHAERKNLAVDVVVVDPRDPCSRRRRSFARS